jgi:hypothetical protein
MPPLIWGLASCFWRWSEAPPPHLTRGAQRAVGEFVESLRPACRGVHSWSFVGIALFVVHSDAIGALRLTLLSGGFRTCS